MKIPVTSREAPELADYVSLRDSQLRRRLEGERGIFIAEGEKIIRRAFEAGARPRSLLLAPKWLPGLADLLEELPEVPCLVAEEALIETISGFHVHRGALAAFERPEETPWEVIHRARRVLLCEGLVDHANTGAIIRVAAALGWDAVLISPDGADPLYRRAVKASMGACFQVGWRRMSDPVNELQQLREHGFTLAATTLAPDAVELAGYRAPEKLALMLGSEGHGLSREWLAAAEVRLTVEMAAGVDSLNVAAAAAIFAHWLR
ncbi:RNA methyltransferase [Arachnia propionica]|uniref:RNA methyltransferase n=1 Tax=Arachnia propionica TaxID=1750 RepID=A0A3P1T8Q6_9ACTN|nr:RNA methyltransferase [Arachnia propionica]MDO5082189.1 RNA methyltransferase [Arachnia propionica]RRD05739.1 RNA methyltransferase [Arachnia propionica]